MARSHTPDTWLITGAASGIGRELASQLARKGEKLVLWDRDAEALERTASLLGPAVTHREVVDVTHADITREAAQRAGDVAPQIKRVIHCAGILRVGPALSVPVSDYRAMMEVNYLGTVHVARAVMPLLVQSGRAGRASQLVLLASIAGLRAVPTLAGYSASKFAVVGFAQALRDELYDEPVEVRVICPPAVDTAMLHNLPALPPVYRLSPPQPVEKVAKSLLRSLDRPEFVSLLDVPSKLMYRITRVAPHGLDRAMRWASRK